MLSGRCPPAFVLRWLRRLCEGLCGIVGQGRYFPSHRSGRPMSGRWCHPRRHHRFAHIAELVARSRSEPGPARVFDLRRPLADGMCTSSAQCHLGWLPRWTIFAESSVVPQHQHSDRRSCSSSAAVWAVIKPLPPGRRRVHAGIYRVNATSVGPLWTWSAGEVSSRTRFSSFVGRRRWRPRSGWCSDLRSWWS